MALEGYDAAGASIRLRNEFASVEVALDEAANGPRLRIRDLDTGREIYLDLMEAESLTRMSREDFVQYVKPT